MSLPRPHNMSRSLLPVARWMATKAGGASTRGSPSWNPDQYGKFHGARFRPGLDLIGQTVAATTKEPASVVDLGCGTGELTMLLKKRWPNAKVTGLDSSLPMLMKAVQQVDGKTVQWEEENVTEWAPTTKYDVIFSNACLQWVPDHATIFPRLASFVNPGGVLAIQMPTNFQAPSHVLMRQLAAEQPFAPLVAGVLRNDPVAEMETYHALLAGGAADVNIWESNFLQVLPAHPSEHPVVEWVKGTGLRPILDALGKTPSVCQEFEREYTRRIAKAYPPQADGTVLFPFKRIFIVVRMKGGDQK